MYFTEGLLSSCTEMYLTSLKDIELCFQTKVNFSSFYIHSFHVIILIKLLRIPILVLNFRIQHPRNSEPLKYLSLGHKKSKISESPKGKHLELADKNHFLNGVRCIWLTRLKILSLCSITILRQ